MSEKSARTKCYRSMNELKNWGFITRAKMEMGKGYMITLIKEKV